MQGVALNRWDTPDLLIRRHRLQDRITKRSEGTSEVQFLFRHLPRLLPVWHEGQVHVLPWSGPCPLEELESGAWQERRPVRVVIPAALCFDRGVWFQVKEGVQGVLVARHLFHITLPSSNYYRVMTRAERMPLLIGEEF